MGPDLQLPLRGYARQNVFNVLWRLGTRPLALYQSKGQAQPARTALATQADHQIRTGSAPAPAESR